MVLYYTLTWCPSPRSIEKINPTKNWVDLCISRPRGQIQNLCFTPICTRLTVEFPDFEMHDVLFCLWKSMHISSVGDMNWMSLGSGKPSDHVHQKPNRIVGVKKSHQLLQGDYGLTIITFPKSTPTHLQEEITKASQALNCQGEER